MSYSRSAVERMIKHYGEVEHIIRDRKGYDVFILANERIIALPVGFERIEEPDIMLIAINKLNIPLTEYDYWLGEQDTRSRTI
jgi:hypothetical protein